MNKQVIIKWLRIIHRDLGYLMVGITIIYGISGIILNHMGEYNPAFKTVEGVLNLSPKLSNDQLKVECEKAGLPNIKGTQTIDSEHEQIYLDGGIAVYNTQTGLFDYETHKKRHFTYWINQLHYNKLGNWSIMADIFAGSLIFFAISGLFLVRGKRGLAGRGKWYLLAGLAIPIIYILLS